VRDERLVTFFTGHSTSRKFAGHISGISSGRI
jgi:hypothetical protein